MYEDDTGLIYMRARYYSPELRRFINADKLHGDISNALSLNRYSFCNGDPANGVDPMGLSAERVGVGTAWGGIHGTSYSSSATAQKRRQLNEAIRNYRKLHRVGKINVEELKRLMGDGTVMKPLNPASENLIYNSNSAHEGLSSILGDIFGASYSVDKSLRKKEYAYINDPWPITYKVGQEDTITMYESGNSSKPISVYANNNMDNPVKSSSAGMKINIFNLHLTVNMGLDDISLSLATTSEDTTTRLGVKLNLSELKVGLEGSTSTSSPDTNITETNYFNVDVSAWLILATYYYLQSGGVYIGSPDEFYAMSY